MSILVVIAALVALGLATARLLLGPTHADRVVALDLALAATVALTGGAALLSGQARMLDVALGITAVGFVSTMAWALFVERLARRSDP